jgi:AraC-like DNA-binding protein
LSDFHCLGGKATSGGVSGSAGTRTPSRILPAGAIRQVVIEFQTGSCLALIQEIRDDLRGFAGEYLRHFDHAQTSYRAREVIVRRLPVGEPRRDEVAGELCMSERTLQRRLEAEATSFIALLDGTRRELAEQYLGRLQLSLAQAAYLLGFADQSSFFRACKRWFDLSPGQYRSQLVRQAAGRVGEL